MSDESIESVAKRSVSRRTALRTGAAVGVGLAAWSSSGASITSLGGTPAYAAGCTFTTHLNLGSPCRNTDQGNCSAPFRYHTLSLISPPAGFSLSNPVAEGTCCDQVTPSPVLTFPAHLTCKVTVLFGTTGNCIPITGATFTYTSTSTSSPGTLTIPLSCYGGSGYPSNTFYTITAACVSSNAPPECLNT
jgi:hypothetical protein